MLNKKNIYKNILFNVLSIIIFFTISSCTTTSTNKIDEKEPFEIISKSNQRFENNDKYFQHEYDYINEKRKKIFKKYNIDKRPPNLIGLSLCGGGIRSKAFQLGLLKGLNQYTLEEDKYNKDINLLNRIDYLSSISGGSWASAAYITYNGNDKDFFKCLDAQICNDEKLTTCNENCNNFNVLSNTQENIFFRALWKNEIESKYLYSINFKLSDLFKKIRKNIDADIYRPYPIYGATHDIKSEFPDGKNYTFEITPHYIGTIEDTCTLTPGEGNNLFYYSLLLFMKSHRIQCYQGFFYNLNSINSKATVTRPWWPFCSKEITMSHAIAISSGFITCVDSWNLNFNYQNLPNVIRKKYNLSDGGKSDNLGCIPLIERKIDNIILTDIPGISNDRKIDYDNIYLSAYRVTKLFPNLTIINVDEKNINNNCFKIIKYTLSNKKKIYIIKPYILSNNKVFINSRFMKEYLINNYRNIYEFLLKNTEDFPNDETAKTSYEKERIYAYYLLGYYISSFNNEFRDIINNEILINDNSIYYQ